MHDLEISAFCHRLHINRRFFRPVLSYMAPVLTLAALVCFTTSLWASSSVTLSPLRLTFPTQTLGTTSAPQTLTLTNFESNAVALNPVTVSGDFAQTNTCGSSLASGSICHIYVTFLPAAAGVRAGTLTLTGNDGGLPQTVALSGSTLPSNGTTATTIGSSGAAGSYTLTGTVTGTGNTGSPTGTLSFTDMSNNGLSLGTAALGAGTVSFVFDILSPPPTGVEPSAIAVGDFNGDGKPDLAIPNPGPPGLTSLGGPLTILLGNGNGTFTRGASPTTVVNPASIAVAGDFNGDGKTDLVVDGGSSGSLIVLLGKGDGTFTTGASLASSSSSSSVAVGDFNGDGKADLAVVGTNSLTIFLGNGDGTFRSLGSGYSIGAYPPSVAVGDFNGDGKADLAVLESDSSVSLWLGNGDGTFVAGASPATQPGDSTLFGTVIVGDFNGDGKTDLATSGVNNNSGTVVITALLGNGDGTFGPGKAISIPASTNAYSIGAGDFNGDGKTDIGFADTQTIALFLSNGDGMFTNAANTTGTTTAPDVSPLAVADLNGDGVPDLAVVDSDTQTVEILLTRRSVTASAILSHVSIPGSGTHNIQAAYGGSTGFGPSNSSTIALTALPIATALNLSSSASSSAYGSQLVLTATLSPSSVGSLTTTGEAVTFNNGGTSIGTATLSSGVATLNITSLPVGNNSLTAQYAGDTNFAPASSSAVAVAVSAPVTLSSASPALTVSAAGGSATAAIQLSPAGGFTGSVNLTCAVNYQGQGTSSSPPTCALNPSQIQVSGTSPVSSTLTISTTQASASTAHDSPWKDSSLALAALFFLGILPRRRRWHGERLLAILCLVAVGSLLGCDGSKSVSSTPKNSGTTTGNYQVVVTAVSGVATTSITIPLSVQ